jgi:hypothetical protein
MTLTKAELLNNLFKKYGLTYNSEDPNSKDNDVFIHKHYKIITRTGIQKIEKSSGIKCNISIVHSGPDFCNVTGTGTTPEGVTYTTLASGNGDTVTGNGYYVEMAEKRCRSRIILTLAGLYEQGVFGEDEAEAFEREPTVKTATFKSGQR